MALQSSQSPLCIFYLYYPRISVLPEGEEFLVVLYGFGFSSFFLAFYVFYTPLNADFFYLLFRSYINVNELASSCKNLSFILQQFQI
jgi:hypothetical protein